MMAPRKGWIYMILGAMVLAVAAVWLIAEQEPGRAEFQADRAVPGWDVEQRVQGRRFPAALVASFGGLGHGFQGPHGGWAGHNPSDNSLAVGPDHIVQTVNTRLAIFTKKGTRFDTTGRVLYGAVPTNAVFKGFGGTCEARNNGYAVARYDQLAQRWLIVMPIFRRSRVSGFLPEWERASIEEHRTLVRDLEAGEVGTAADLLRDVHWSFTYQERFVRLYYAAGQVDAAADD